MAKHSTQLTILTYPPQALHPVNASLSSTNAFLAASETLQRLNMGSLSRIEATVSLPSSTTTSTSTLHPSTSSESQALTSSTAPRGAAAGERTGKKTERETERDKAVESLLVIQSAVRDTEDIPLLVTGAGDADRRAELKLRVRRMEEAGRKWGRMIERQ